MPSYEACARKTAGAYVRALGCALHSHQLWRRRPGRAETERVMGPDHTHEFERRGDALLLRHCLAFDIAFDEDRETAGERLEHALGEPLADRLVHALARARDTKTKTPVA